MRPAATSFFRTAHTQRAHEGGRVWEPAWLVVRPSFVEVEVGVVARRSVPNLVVNPLITGQEQVAVHMPTDSTFLLAGSGKSRTVAPAAKDSLQPRHVPHP